MAVRVHSEVGRLRKVIVHSPGPELLAVTPSNRTEYLYDDIIDLPGAGAEHALFVGVLRRFAAVVEVAELLAETLAQPAAREFLVTRSEEVTADRSLAASLRGVDVATLLARFVGGWRPSVGPFSESLGRLSYVLPPVPNLLFTRDAAVVLGSAAVIGAMRFGSRWPEEALMRTLFGFHPDFAGTSIIYDGSDERRHGYSFEGGDVHVLRDDLVLVGISERTTAASLDILTDILFAHTPVSDVIAVVLPEASPAIHLDMVWTQVDRERCAVHPPLFFGLNRCPVLHRRRHEAGARQPADLFAALRDAGMPLHAIRCGGSRPDSQEREQWASGCNFFAVAPGQVIAYARNVETLRAMEADGFAIVPAAQVAGSAAAAATPLGDGPQVFTLPGGELVRGGGGPRCMTCPVEREAV